MQLKLDTDRALQAWIGPDTWHTPHMDDMNRWYDFVNQYQRDYGFKLDEPELRETIERKRSQITGKCFINEDLRKEIRKRISIAYHILDFLKHTGR